MGGWRHIVGDPDRPAARVGISIGDTLAATYGCLGALAALHHRERTGQGQIIDASLYESVLQVMESLIPEYALSGYVRQRTGSILPNVAPSNVYRCSDGEYLIGANQDTVFRRLCTAIGEPALAEDPRYSTHVQRGIHQRELDEHLESWTRQRRVSDVEAVMIAHGIPAGRIYKAADMLADPHFRARGAIVEVEHPKWGRFPMQNAFPRLSATPTGVRALAPQSVGEHNHEVLERLLALTREQIESLRLQGVV
jgi:formyl-CoA transferase